MYLGTETDGWTAGDDGMTGIKYKGRRETRDCQVEPEPQTLKNQLTNLILLTFKIHKE